MIRFFLLFKLTWSSYSIYSISIEVPLFLHIPRFNPFLKEAFFKVFIKFNYSWFSIFPSSRIVFFVFLLRTVTSTFSPMKLERYSWLLIGTGMNSIFSILVKKFITIISWSLIWHIRLTTSYYSCVYGSINGCKDNDVTCVFPTTIQYSRFIHIF